MFRNDAECDNPSSKYPKVLAGAPQRSSLLIVVVLAVTLLMYWEDSNPHLNVGRRLEAEVQSKFMTFGSPITRIFS